MLVECLVVVVLAMVVRALGGPAIDWYQDDDGSIYNTSNVPKLLFYCVMWSAVGLVLFVNSIVALADMGVL